jgi:hypothetical protein
VSRSTGPSLPVWEGSGVAMHPTALTPPPYAGGLRDHHASRGSRPRLPAWEGSETATRFAAPDPASQVGGLRDRHTSRGSRLRLPTQKGSGAAACPATYGKRIKKYQATTVRLEGSLVTKERSPGPRHLQDAWAGGDIMTYKAPRRYNALLQ